MNVCEQNLTVMMIREHLREVSQFSLPLEFFLREYSTGYEKQWFEIHQQTERLRKITPEVFVETFGQDATLLKQRQFYIFDKCGKAIGTGTAWFDENFRGQRFGRVHWMAILPEFQRRGLSNSLMSAVCNRLKDLGHERAYLRTSTARIPAINLYLKFGFVPLIEKPEDKIIWQELRPHLKRPLYI